MINKFWVDAQTGGRVTNLNIIVTVSANTYSLLFIAALLFIYARQVAGYRNPDRKRASIPGQAPVTASQVASKDHGNYE